MTLGAIPNAKLKELYRRLSHKAGRYCDYLDGNRLRISWVRDKVSIELHYRAAYGIYL